MGLIKFLYSFDLTSKFVKGNGTSLQVHYAFKRWDFVMVSTMSWMLIMLLNVTITRVPVTIAKLFCMGKNRKMFVTIGVIAITSF